MKFLANPRYFNGGARRAWIVRQSYLPSNSGGPYILLYFISVGASNFGMVLSTSIDRMLVSVLYIDPSRA